MIVRAIRVYVQDGRIADFKAATVENRRGSILEEGILRFDVLQSRENPGEFLLYEVYRDEDAAASHKETPHYAAWKAAVSPMMASDRASTAYEPVDPVSESDW